MTNESESVTPEIFYGQCDFCHRKFAEDVLKRHLPVCKGLQRKQHRKTFNSAVQRATNSDIPLDKFIKSGKVSRPNSRLQRAISKKNDWRRKHLDLINILQSSRGLKPTPGLKTSDKIERQLPADYKMCQYCKRYFQEDAAKRHVIFCKDVHLRMDFKENFKHPPSSNKFMIKTEAIPQYKYSKYKKKDTKSPLEVNPIDCINNSSLVLKKNELEPLRTGRSENDYKKAINDLAIRFSGSRIPKNDVKSLDLKPILTYNCNEFYHNERNLQSSLSFPYNSRISPNQGELSPRTCNSLPHESQSESSISASIKLAKFCFQCGIQYSKSCEKYCINCGTYRFVSE